MNQVNSSSATVRPNAWWPSIKGLALGLALACTTPALAMQELEDGDLREATGEGIAIVLSDIALKMGPTSFIELTGTDEAAGSELNYRRGDLRWYGLSYTSGNRQNAGTTAAGQTWGSSPCSNGFLNLGCPLGGTIAKLAPHDNPLLLRAFDYVGTSMTGATNVTRSVLELLYPSRHEKYRFAFWGEMNVGTGSTVGTGNTGGSLIGTGADKLQVQNIWSNIDQGGTIIRLFQTTTGTDDTLGLQFINKFSADIRMSVAQRLGSPDTLGQTPEFDDTEGLYIGDYRVFMPVGQLHYQALVADDVSTSSGNFQLMVTQLPNLPAVYNEFYGRTAASDPTGGYDRSLLGASNVGYHKTHGYVRMGDFAPTHKANTQAAFPYVQETSTGSPANWTVPMYGKKNAPVIGLFSEIAACMPDRSSCSAGGTNGINTPYNTSDGLFFVAAPGETFKVFAKSPNYLWDASSNPKSDPDGVEDATMDPDFGSNDPNVTTISAAENPRLDISRINLGDTNIQGMAIHSLTLKTLGAQ